MEVPAELWSLCGRKMLNRSRDHMARRDAGPCDPRPVSGVAITDPDHDRRGAFVRGQSRKCGTCAGIEILSTVLGTKKKPRHLRLARLSVVVRGKLIGGSVNRATGN